MTPLSLPKILRKERDSPDISVPKEVTVKETPLKCEYWNCKYQHVLNKSFKYPESTEEFECVFCDLVFLADQNYATHVIYFCYYLHSSKDSVSSGYGIFC